MICIYTFYCSTGNRDYTEYFFHLQVQVAWTQVDKSEVSPVCHEEGKRLRKETLQLSLWKAYFLLMLKAYFAPGSVFNSKTLDHKRHLKSGWTWPAFFQGTLHTSTHFNSLPSLVKHLLLMKIMFCWHPCGVFSLYNNTHHYQNMQSVLIGSWCLSICAFVLKSTKIALHTKKFWHPGSSTEKIYRPNPTNCWGWGLSP